MRLLATAFCCLPVTGLTACSQFGPLPWVNVVRPPSLDDRVLSEYRSGPELAVRNGHVLTDNDDAFEKKLELVKAATSTIDLAFYIFSDDYSSSLLARELLAATKRGVRVRMLLDYHSHYQSLNYFHMLEQFGNTGSGSLSVRFYNRPSRNIVKEALYMTLGCGQDKPELMIMAVVRGQDLDIAQLKSGAAESNPEDTEKLKELASAHPSMNS